MHGEFIHASHSLKMHMTGTGSRWLSQTTAGNALATTKAS
jgi:hypothetical protein